MAPTSNRLAPKVSTASAFVPPARPENRTAPRIAPAAQPANSAQANLGTNASGVGQAGPRQNRPAWAASASAAPQSAPPSGPTVPHVVKSLSANGFYESLELQSVSHSPVARMPTLPFGQTENTAVAQEYWQQLQRLTLEHNPEALSQIRRASAQFFSHFQPRNPAGIQVLRQAIAHYIDGDYPHYFLFDLMSVGHRKLKDYLQSLNIAQPGDKQTARDFWDDLQNTYHHETRPRSEALTHHFENDIQQQGNLLNYFLNNGINLSGITLAHGMDTHHPEGYSIAVNAQDFLTNFVNGNPTRFKTPVSTSAKTSVAEDFGAEPISMCPPPTAIYDITDKSAANQARCQVLLDEIAQLGPNTAHSPAILHYFRCSGAKGQWLEQNTTESELLLAKDHVSTPVVLIQGPRYFILVSDISHRPPAQG